MADEKPAAKRSKLLLGIAIGAVVAGGGSAGAFLFLGKQSPAQAAKAPSPEPGPVEKLPTLIVNLRDSSPGANRYLKTTVELELATSKDVEKLKKFTAPVRHHALMMLSSLTVADVQAEGGRDALVRTLLAKIRASAPGVEIRNLYVTELVIQ
jgi:flagellar FliL protein